MLAILGIAVGSLYADATAEGKVLSRRVEDVQAKLISLKRRLPEDSSRAQLPDVQYLECKSVYLEAKRYNKEHENPAKTARRDASPHHTARRWGEPSGRAVAARRDASPHHAAVTKADLRAAVKTIIRGEDVFASKLGPTVFSFGRSFLSVSSLPFR